jgi:hypothetical protein
MTMAEGRKEAVMRGDDVRMVRAVALHVDDGFSTPVAAGGSQACEGERRLVAAVLEDAIACFQHHRFARRPSVRRLYEDAEAWLFGTDGGAFSFEDICQLLEIDADWLRAGLSAWEANPIVTVRAIASAGAKPHRMSRDASSDDARRLGAVARRHRTRRGHDHCRRQSASRMS